MARGEPVARDAIIRALTEALEPQPWADAFWEGGSAAFGRVDAYSDVDLYVVVANDKVARAFEVVEAALRRLSPIRTKYEPTWPPESGTAQAFYRLEGASEYLLVDLAVFKRSAADKYLERELHGQAIFAFNKGNVVKIPPWNRDTFVTKLLERCDRLRLRVELFGPFVDKELRRGNDLGALEAYQRIVLDALDQVLWMRYHPAHYAFGLRYMHYELPKTVVARLERLSFVSSPEELRNKSRRAVEWFHETAGSIREEDLRSRLAS